MPSRWIPGNLPMMQAVTNRKEWPQISSEVGTKDHSKIKAFYLKYLLPFEKRNYFGAEADD